MTGRRIGVMGGTFDPIHVGHLAAANEAAAWLSLDEVVFVPTGRPWQKSGTEISSAEDRYLMTVLATAANPRFQVSRVDVDRPGPTYAIDTLRDLRTTYGPAVEFFFIVGADTLESVLSWRDVEKVLSMATFVAVNRPGYDASAGHLKDLAVVRHIEMPQVGISGSDCRARVAAGLPIRYLVPEDVVRYIELRGLYRPAQRPSTDSGDG